MERFFSHLQVCFSRFAAFFSAEKQLHTARFARIHELKSLLGDTLEGTSLLLGESSFSHVLRVAPTENRRELGNVLVVAPTRGGKGLLATSQLLTWPHSAIVNDVKGELWNLTGGYREKLGKVFVIDPTGVGHQYDPLHGRESERELYSSAKHLLFEPHEGEGTIFTQRATKMLSLLFRAARLENRAAGKEHYRLLPYVGQMVNVGLKQAAARLQTISPELATKFLAGAFQEANFADDKFLLSAWGTLDARLFPLLTDDVLRCFDGSDFTPQDIMMSDKPITVYLRWPESELLALAPLVRLIIESLIHELITCFDKAAGQNCHPVLLLIDEGGITGIPNLHHSATTVAGRGISLWLAIQSLSQLDAVYGKHRADTLRNNMESQLYYRQASHDTAKYLEDRLGKRSEFAHSKTQHQGVETSQGQVEQAVALMTAQAITQLGDTELIGFHRNIPPFRALRMDWRRFPHLAKRRTIPPPKLPVLPPLAESLPETAGQSPEPLSSWHPDPSLFRRGRPSPSTNGFRKKRIEKRLFRGE